jgi:branched-chain amino acid transport system permease protein
MRRRLALVVAIIAALALLPLYLRSEFWLTFWILVLLYAFLGQAWNVLGGYGGQSSFGHAAFFGTGAYATALFQLRLGLDPWTSAALATASGALVGVAIGALSFRYGLRGSYFALVTLAFAEVFRILANSFEVFGSGSGLLIPLRLGATNFQFADRRGFFYLALGLVALSLMVALWLEHSRFGARLMALRENEEAAQALGVDVFAVKLGAIALSAALTALAGILYAQLFLYVDPGIAFGPGMSVEALLVPIIGGAGTMLGPLLGSIVLQTLGELGRQATGGAPGLGLVLQGVLLILVLAFLPDGIVGLLRRVRGRMTLRHA